MQANETQIELANSHHADAGVVLFDETCSKSDKETGDDGMMFFMHYVAVCVILILAMASLLDPYAVLIGVVFAAVIGSSVWLTATLAQMFSESMKGGE